MYLGNSMEAFFAKCFVARSNPAESSV